MFKSDDKSLAPMIHIVDDDEGVRTALDALLKSMGWQTAVFSSGDHYLAEADDDEEACLLLDLQMPGANGADVVEALSRLGRKVSTIIMTAHPNSNLMERVRRLGIRRVLCKPFDEDELIRELKAVLALDPD